MNFKSLFVIIVLLILMAIYILKFNLSKQVNTKYIFVQKGKVLFATYIFIMFNITLH